MPMPRKSVAEHDLHNTKPHYDTGPTGRQSHIAGGKPKAPKYLSDVARKKFKALSRELVARRVATPGDSDLIAMYATLWERWRIADDHVRAEGCVITKQYYSRTGEPYTREVKNPWLEVAQACEKQMSGCLEKLGLSVATRDRAKPVAPDAPKEDEIIPGSIGEMYADLEREARDLKPLPFIRPEDMIADEPEPIGEPDGTVEDGN